MRVTVDSVHPIVVSPMACAFIHSGVMMGTLLFHLESGRIIQCVDRRLAGTLLLNATFVHPRATALIRLTLFVKAHMFVMPRARRPVVAAMLMGNAPFLVLTLLSRIGLSTIIPRVRINRCVVVGVIVHPARLYGAFPLAYLAYDITLEHFV